MLNRHSYESIKVTERARLNQKLQVTNLAAAAKGYLTNKSRKEMIQTELKGHRVLVVDLPEGTESVSRVHIFHGEDPLVFHDKEGKNIGAIAVSLGWSFLFADPLHPTEQEAAQWVESGYFDGVGIMYANYGIQRRWTFGKTFHTALASFQSWLRSVWAKENSVVLINKTESNG